MAAHPWDVEVTTAVVESTTALLEVVAVGKIDLSIIMVTSNSIQARFHLLAGFHLLLELSGSALAYRRLHLHITVAVVTTLMVVTKAATMVAIKVIINLTQRLKTADMVGTVETATLRHMVATAAHTTMVGASVAAEAIDKRRG